MANRNIDEILNDAAVTIQRIHRRPSMYIGSEDFEYAAEMFDGMTWLAHHFWAMIQNRDSEFRDILSATRALHQCSSQGFADAFRRHNPNADPRSVFEYVRRCWAEIDAELGIDLRETPDET